MSKKSVIIVDDHLLFARSLKFLVNSFPEYEVEEIFSNGQDYISYLQKNKKQPDILLLDIKMPVMDGLETMKWINEHQPNHKVLALTMEDDEKTIISMLRLGANGYLLKDIDPDEFLRALETLQSDGFYHSDFLKRILNKDSKEQLSEKEIEFIKYSCSELTYKEIASKMNRSPKTIDGYRESLFEKLQVRSRTGMVLYAIKHKIFTV